MVGPSGSGKTALITRCVRPGNERRGSDTVDFTCLRKPNQLGKTDIACIWKLPGNDCLAAVLACKDKV